MNHYLVEAKVVVRLHGTKQTSQKAPKFRQPSDEEKEAYNRYLARRLAVFHQTTMNAWHDIYPQILAAAETSLTKKPKKQRRDYLSAETWRRIEERQAAHVRGDSESVPFLTQQIKKR